jgi:hypothetical protein
MATPAAALAATAEHTRHTGLPAATVNWQIPLNFPVGHTGAGSVQYQGQPGQREFQIEIDHARTLYGHPLLVQINGQTIGTMRVSAMGIAQLSRNSELGQHVPLVTHAATVTVKTGAGTLIASATF